MKKIQVLTVLALQLLGVMSTFAAVNFGSRNSAIEVSGGTVDFTGDATLSKGTLRISGAGQITGDAGTEVLTCTDLTVEKSTGTTHKTMRVDGALTLHATDLDSATISLGNDEVLVVNGGSVAQTITAAGATSTPSVIQGSGSFAANIGVTDAKQVNMRWQGALDTNVALAGSSAVVQLEDDLTFSGTNRVTGTGTVKHNGYKITYDDGVVLDSAQTWDATNVEFGGSTTISAAITLTTAGGFINGKGNDITGTSGFLGSVTATLANAKLMTYDSSTIGGSGVWTLNNVTMKNGSEALRVIDGSILGGSANFFAGAGTWNGNSEIELLGDIALGGAWTMSGTLAINGNGHKINVGSGDFGLATGTTAIKLTDCYIDGIVATALNGTTDRDYILTNTILDTGSEAVRVLEGTLAPTSGTDLNPFAAPVTWTSASMELLRDVTPGATWTLATAFDFNGNGKKFNVGTAGFAAGSITPTISDATFSGLTNLRLVGTGAWTLVNTIFDDGTNSLIIDGQLTENNANDDLNLFSNDVIVSAATHMTLVKDCTPASTWQLGAATEIDGGGHTFNCGGSGKRFDINTGVLSFKNINIAEVVGASFDSAGAAILSLNNVKWFNDANTGAIHVHGAGSVSTLQGPTTLTMDGTTTSGDIFAGTGVNAIWGAVGSTGANISLLSNTSLSGEWNFVGASSLNGNGHTLNFAASTGMLDFDANLTLTDITLANVASTSFDNGASADLLLSNVTWIDAGGAGALRINPTPYVAGAAHAQLSLVAADTTAGDIFASAVTWNNGAHLSLLQNTSLAATWTFTNKTVIDGGGHLLDVASGQLNCDEDMYLSNVILGGVDSASFDVASGKFLYLSNVTWMEDANASGVSGGAMHITASAQADANGVAKLTVATGGTGAIFAEDVTWENGATIQLLKDSTLTGTWTFDDHTTIDGGGSSFDIVGGVLKIADGKKLTLQNMVISDIASASLFSDTGFETGTLILSNVTIKMSADVSWSAKGTDLTINGPVTFICGSHTFTPQTSGSTINGVTVWYDALGQGGSVGSFATNNSNGRVSAIAESSTADLSYTASSKTVTDSVFLNYAATGAPGKQVEITNSSSFVIEGNGRSWYMGNTGDTTSGNIVTFTSTSVVGIQDLVIDNFNTAAIENNAYVEYSDGAVLRLQDDLALQTAIKVGYSSTTEANEVVTFDLNNHDLDMSHASAAFTITDTTATLTFKGGRIVNLKDETAGTSKFAFTGSVGEDQGRWATLEFEDVDLVLSGDTTFTSASIVFKGNCSISATTSATASFWHTGITIASGATLTVNDGVTFELNEDQTDGITGSSSNWVPDIRNATITFGSTNATLNLLGSTMTNALTAAPSLASGTIRVDDQVSFTKSGVGLGWTWASSLDLDICPGASILVPSGTITQQ